GSAGSVQLELEEDPNAQAASGGRGLLQAVVARGGRLAEISLDVDAGEHRPARVVQLSVPFLQPLIGEVIGATVLGTCRLRTGRARWR
ncbi:MAG: hypothetical protein M3N32_03125, partial [Actinomycetota bacterium]|nr:hypothetical protein [Actinomycetota bacterium]